MKGISTEHMIVAEFNSATSVYGTYSHLPRLPAYLFIGNSGPTLPLLTKLQDLLLLGTDNVIPAIVDERIAGYLAIRGSLLADGWPVYPTAEKVWAASESKCLYLASPGAHTVVYLVDEHTDGAQSKQIHGNVMARLNDQDKHVTGDTAVVLKNTPEKDWMIGLNDERKKVVFNGIFDVVHYWYRLIS